MWPSTSLSSVCEQTHLLKAWAQVKANKGGPGSDGVTLAQFEKDLHYRLAGLRRKVFRHQYQPEPLKVVWMKKPSGGLRKLAIPSVADRILQTAVYLKLMPIMDEEFENASFGYRPGRSVYHALAQLQQAYQQGYHWLADADPQWLKNCASVPAISRDIIGWPMQT